QMQEFFNSLQINLRDLGCREIEPCFSRKRPFALVSAPMQGISLTDKQGGPWHLFTAPNAYGRFQIGLPRARDVERRLTQRCNHKPFHRPRHQHRWSWVSLRLRSELPAS